MFVVYLKKSFIYIMINNKGPRIDPCGMQIVKGKISELFLHLLVIFVVRGNTRLCFHGWSVHEHFFILTTNLAARARACVRACVCVCVCKM